MKIGVFDSGIGGEAVALSLKKHFPTAEFITISDPKNLPYGLKSNEEIIDISRRAVRRLVDTHCDVIVIACNTASTIALPSLKESYPQQQFIGIEPMLMLASERSTTKTICVCATPATLASERYKKIKETIPGTKVIEPNCSDWAQMIEDNAINEARIARSLEAALKNGADEIVLGCTHYHWIEELITKIAAHRARVIEPSEDLAKRIKQLIDPVQR